MAKVLVIDDEANLRKVLAAMLRRDGFDVTVAENGEQGLAEFHKNGADIIVTDLVMPKVGGMEVLSTIRSANPDVPVIIITAHGTVDSAVDAIKAGAFDYITKPFDQTELSAVVAKAAKTNESARRSVRPDLKARAAIIGESPQMQDVYKVIDKVADTPSTVLITGESGTGKELIATALHGASSRRDKPFIKINCAAIPATLLESELFGYERGAFTGAVTSKPGRFELADGGTLFLDEIGEIPVEMQVKLLRALQEGEFERVGGIKTTRVDVRLVAATNRDLQAEIEAGRFRKDLYYRLAVVPLTLPPLRERRSDILMLARHFVDKYNRRLNKKIEGITDDALALLQGYAWPGNIRELENLIERALLFADGPLITAKDLPEPVRQGAGVQASPAPPPSAPTLEVPTGEVGLKDIVRMKAAELERDLIVKKLDETGGNVTRAARLLQISRKSLQTKMKEFGLRDTTPDEQEDGPED
ncbi:sigma-54-dependent Fis family transcriptional regulator [Myxococcus sp. CA051A]|uniref:Sigma-54-dependent Fis family transcriptional regulator n=1 Tax=Myxococcus llanfairpwllgwyngyllgogerychwyrndrobwllllantysiliogogogochensis TaxID=2590453 RepID=A0A540WSB7_9BACT|nr:MULTISPECIES: sigma-54 dependent transcriptional regulator [Myxococcus]NTX06944.1 sigma-54-dependent Fis family transcriptional regulator [Myxococcus sp. CA040A]NTX62363.1 sigma-54-dependent Fis family transcriptional regulator [Myxococcus sp. CA051A]TQF11921.1 sigma-54-dependent Fis family transcriptional regulator [Myxococcus llanfairpwllgwyngyllgogerychwyrndrobwllllantysiliogogogochensis]